MADESLTHKLNLLLERVRAGDARAKNDLLGRVCQRLEELVRRQLKSFPAVHRWEQTEDVLQGVLLRLSRALDAVAVQDLKHFFALSGEMIRRELIDLKRHYCGPEGIAPHHSTEAVNPQRTTQAGQVENASSDTLDPEKLAWWSEFHQKVAQMDPELLEVVNLLWYQGLEQEEAAEVLGVSSKTISRRWREARMHLGQWLTKE